MGKHITKFTVSMSHGSKREGVRQRKLQQLRNELVIKDKNFQSKYYLPFMKNTGSYT